MQILSPNIQQVHIEKNIRNKLVLQALDPLNSCFSVSAVTGLASPRVGEEGETGISQLISLVYPVLCPLSRFWFIRSFQPT